MPQHRVFGLFHVLKESREVRDAGRIGFAEFNTSLCGKCAWHARILTRSSPSRKPGGQPVERQKGKLSSVTRKI
jgi:hypothetical protein